MRLASTEQAEGADRLTIRTVSRDADYTAWCQVLIAVRMSDARACRSFASRIGRASLLLLAESAGKVVGSGLPDRQVEQIRRIASEPLASEPTEYKVGRGRAAPRTVGPSL